MPAPDHIGVILDGNRRWAAARGLSPSDGHRAGFGKISDLLHWCHELGVGTVTLWMLSDDNVRNRSRRELRDLYEIIASTVEHLARDPRWQLRHIGTPGLLPCPLEEVLRRAQARSCRHTAMTVNLAVGYGGRQDLLTAVDKLVCQWP